MHKLRFLGGLFSLVGFVATAGCSRTSGTYLVLDLSGTVSTQAPIRSIELDLDMGGITAHTIFTDPAGGDIALSTNAATLKIQHGSGHHQKGK